MNVIAHQCGLTPCVSQYVSKLAVVMLARPLLALALEEDMVPRSVMSLYFPFVAGFFAAVVVASAAASCTS